MKLTVIYVAAEVKRENSLLGLSWTKFIKGRKAAAEGHTELSYWSITVVYHVKPRPSDDITGST